VWFWVDSNKAGLGFQRTERRRREEEREAIERNEGIRVKDLLYKALDRVGFDPIQRPTFLAFRSRSYWIRINPTPLMRSGDPDPSICVGLGRVPKAFCFSFQFLDFLAVCTPVLAVWTPCAFNFFIKIPKKITMCSWYVFWLFGDIFTCSGLMKIIRVNFTFDSYILCVFAWIFLCNFWSKTCHVMLMFGT